MKVYDAASLRNVALVGHSGSGKTQLASAILADANMINRFGKVDEGTTVTDYDEEEIARKHTLPSSLPYPPLRPPKINLLDTPLVPHFLPHPLTSLRESCSGSVIPIQLPIGDERAFCGVVDLVSKKAFVFKTDGSGACSEAPVPAEMAAAVNAAREALIEMVAENEETLMEHFFEAGTLTDDGLVAGLRSATVRGKLFPPCCT